MNTGQHWVFALGAVTMLSATCPLAVSAANTYNCSGGIVSVGDASVIVRDRCGEPQQIENASGGGADHAEENWYYLGNTKLPFVFRMRGGTLVAIQRLKR